MQSRRWEAVKRQAIGHFRGLPPNEGRPEAFVSLGDRERGGFAACRSLHRGAVRPPETSARGVALPATRRAIVILRIGELSALCCAFFSSTVTLCGADLTCWQLGADMTAVEATSRRAG